MSVTNIINERTETEDRLSDEIIINGDFATDSDWDLGVGWSINNGKAVAENATTTCNQDTSFTSGKTYKVVFTVSDYESGTVRAQFTGGGATNGTNRTANGTYTEYIVANASLTRFRLQGLGGGFTGSVDNLSIKEVGVDREAFSNETNQNGSSNIINNVNERVETEDRLGSELVTNGDFATDSDWFKSGGWTISEGKANRSGVSTNDYVGQDFNVIVGRNYIVKYDRTYVSGDGQTNLFAYFEGNSSRTTRGNYEDTTQETVTVTDYFTPTYTGNLALRFYGISDFTGSIDNLSVKEVGADREAFTNETNQNGVSVINNVVNERVETELFEPEATNTATYSNDFTQGDIFDGSGNPNAVKSVITATSTTSPDGTNNGWKLTDNNDGGTTTAQMAYYSTNVTSGDSNTFSIFLKKGSTDFAYITSGGFDSTSNGTSYFNLSTGAISLDAANHSNVKMEYYGNGWYRCSISNLTTTDVVGSFVVGISTSSGDINITRDGSNFLYMFGVQAETTGFCTSYIPTNGSVQTRAEKVFKEAFTNETDQHNSTVTNIVNERTI